MKMQTAAHSRNKNLSKFFEESRMLKEHCNKSLKYPEDTECWERVFPSQQFKILSTESWGATYVGRSM